MRLKGLKNLITEDGGGGRATPGVSSVAMPGGSGEGKIKPVNAMDALGKLAGFGATVQSVVNDPTSIVGKAGAVLATPRSQLMAAASGRSSGLGWSKETAAQRFTHFRKELPGVLGAYGGMVGRALGQTDGSGGPVAKNDITGRLLSNKWTNLAGNLLKPLEGYARAGGDELAKIASAATGDFRDTSVLGTLETKPIERETVQKVKLIK